MEKESTLKTTINKIKLGELFRLKDSDTAPVWVRDEYNRETKKYLCHKYEDTNHWSLKKGTTEVWVGFTY